MKYFNYTYILCLLLINHECTKDLSEIYARYVQSIIYIKKFIIYLYLNIYYQKSKRYVPFSN